MSIRLITALFLSLIAAACGQDDAGDVSPAPEPQAEAPAPAPAPAAALERRPSPPGSSAYIVSPADGATVDSPVRVLFGLRGAGVVPAGIELEGAGHHHLLIDTGLPDLGLPIPADNNHVHFGGGQTEVEIVLAAGTHTLQLLLGDERHVPHDPPIMSEQITIEVR
ncbi:MAG TPA: DUF4399 domain-containing protein [Gammaproteobacteria bacterium]|jgi:hypothetical protein